MTNATFLDKIAQTIIDNYIDSVRSGNYKDVIRKLMINYYDPMYEHNKKNYVYTIENTDPENSADILINKFINKENS